MIDNNFLLRLLKINWDKILLKIYIFNV